MQSAGNNNFDDYRAIELEVEREIPVKKDVYMETAYINHLQQIIGEEAVARLIESGHFGKSVLE